jgi:hypothetical protein
MILSLCEGEKLSKAAILQQTAEYIYSLEQEKTRWRFLVTNVFYLYLKYQYINRVLTH